jgi:hypothetical protein
MKTAFAIKHLALLSAKRMLLPLCAFALSGATATAAAYTQLYVIGHSLSMTNSGGYPGYWGNGMSNGPMWPEYLAGRWELAIRRRITLRLAAPPRSN